MSQHEIFSIISFYCAQAKKRMSVVEKALARVARKEDVEPDFMKEVFAHCLRHKMTLGDFLRISESA